MDIIEIAKECGAYVVDEGVDWTSYVFGEDELQQFAQRIQQPHLQRIADLEFFATNGNARIAELEKQVEQLRDELETERDEVQSLESDIAGYENDEIKLNEQIEQLREALLQCKGFVDAYGQPETKEIVRKALEGK